MHETLQKTQEVKTLLNPLALFYTETSFSLKCNVEWSPGGRALKGWALSQG